ncbi:MAG: flagellar motor protein [Bacillota bacterium]|nr:flagellar motor protein [Bacillota bacterium]HWR56212.1 flagellar motor protein [Negativicutes bacterium]
MDLATSLGLGLAIFSLAASVVIEGGHLGSLFSVPASIIVFGGTIGATVIGFSVKELKNVPTLFKIGFMGKDVDALQMIQILVRFAEKARREGLLALEDDLGAVDNDFLKKGMQLVIDGTDAELVRNILETELNFIQERHDKGAAIFEAAGGFAPTMGIIGTVMGLVHVLGNLNDTDSLGPAIATAFIATLYGVASANVLFLPLAAKLKNRSANEILVYEVTLEGILSVQSGDNPRIVEEKLKAFLAPELRKNKLQAGGGE